MAVNARPFRPTNNVNILNAIRRNATIDYQRRIPAATQANVQDVVRGMLSWSPTRNEFVDALVNRIGMNIYRYNSWTNPLGKFKRGMLEFGDTIEEVNVGLLEAKRYNPDREYLEEDLFGQERPDVQSSFHKINRQDFYKLTVNESLLKRAFLADDGLSGFITSLMAAPETSDNYDEFLLMTSLFGEYDKAGGFFYVNTPDVAASGSTETDAKSFLRSVREYSQKLPFISTHYNAAGMPVAASPDELELFITPEASAAIDVEALAAAFNIEKAAIPSRTTVIPRENFGVVGAQAVLTTRDFFVVADSKLETTSVYNPVGLHSNYFLHHWQTISASRFVPALLFTTGEGSVITIADTPVTGVTPITVTDSEGVSVTDQSVVRGDLYQLDAEAITDGDNTVVRWDIEGATSNLTRLTQSGVLVIGADERGTAGTMKVVATAVDTSVVQKTAELVLQPVGDLLELWPNPEVLQDSNLNGLPEVTPAEIVQPTATAGKDKNVVIIPSVEGVYYTATPTTGGVTGTIVDSGRYPITEDTNFMALPSNGYEIATGAVTSWSITFTA